MACITLKTMNLIEIGLSFETIFDKTDEKYKKYFHSLHFACCCKL